LHRPGAGSEAGGGAGGGEHGRGKSAVKKTHTAFVGLGGNIGDRRAALENALAALAGADRITVDACSRLFESAPIGMERQADFMNAVCRVQTALSPLQLLAELQRMETAAGRVRGGARFGPRVLDLDLLLYGRVRCAGETLTLPHPRMAGRRFVLAPLVEIAPEVCIPGHGRAADLLAAVAGQKCRPLGDLLYSAAAAEKN